MASFDEYSEKYRNIRMERHGGILQITLHSDSDSLEWGEVPHRELGYAFTDIGSDPENRVVIMTGTGDDFIVRGGGRYAPWKTPPPGSNQSYTYTALWDKTYWEGKRLLINLLDIEVPVISAVNGRAFVHSEIPVLCDIVLAVEDAAFQDTHFSRGTVPGDGVHIVWPTLLGLNRGRYFLLTGQKLSAREALELGVVHEVLPPERLIPRAWELAEQLAQKPDLTLRYSKVVLTMYIKRLMQDMLGYGLSLEGLGVVDVAMQDG